MTKRNILTAVVSVLVFGLLVTGVVGLAAGNGPADGSCDNPLQRDHDGDGILNCNDEDWTPPQDGTGYGAQGEKGRGRGQGEGEYGSGKGARDGGCDGEGPHGNAGRGRGRGKGRS